MVNCTDYTNILKSIAEALDEKQKDQTKIAQFVEIWINLIDKLKGNKRDARKLSEKKKEMVLSPAHLAANVLEHRYCGRKFIEE